MSVSQKFQFEELDDQSRDYLLHARDRAGRGMPGIFMARQDALPAVGCIVGACVLVGMAALSWSLMEQEPLAVAMLETAGLLLGGWLVLYAIRTWGAAKGSRYAGNFVYADAETLWECDGSTVTTTDLLNVVKAKGVQQYNSEKKYTHTAVTVRLNDDSRSINVHNEKRAGDLICFLNALAWLRSGGDVKSNSDLRPQGDVDLKNLPPAIMGAVALELAINDELPASYSADALGIDVTDVPTPKKEGRAASGILMYLAIVAVAVGGVFLFNELNVGWRDDAIWTQINKFEEPHKHEAAPWLRAYLADSRNVKHRDDARAMLRDIYMAAINRIKAKADPANPLNFGGETVDPRLVDGLALVLAELAEQPAAIVTVSVKEKPGGVQGVTERENDVRREYTLALMNAVGQQLVAFVEAPESSPGMIEITYEGPKQGGNVRLPVQIYYTLAFRKATDGDVVKRVSKTISATNNPTVLAESARKIGEQTAGPKKIELQQLDDI